jgi:hypothetical protein
MPMPTLAQVHGELRRLRIELDELMTPEMSALLILDRGIVAQAIARPEALLLWGRPHMNYFRCLRLAAGAHSSPVQVNWETCQRIVDIVNRQVVLAVHASLLRSREWSDQAQLYLGRLGDNLWSRSGAHVLRSIAAKVGVTLDGGASPIIDPGSFMRPSPLDPAFSLYLRERDLYPSLTIMQFAVISVAASRLHWTRASNVSKGHAPASLFSLAEIDTTSVVNALAPWAPEIDEGSVLTATYLLSVDNRPIVHPICTASKEIGPHYPCWADYFPVEVGASPQSGRLAPFTATPAQLPYAAEAFLDWFVTGKRAGTPSPDPLRQGPVANAVEGWQVREKGRHFERILVRDMRSAFNGSTGTTTHDGVQVLPRDGQQLDPSTEIDVLLASEDLAVSLEAKSHYLAQKGASDVASVGKAMRQLSSARKGFLVSRCKPLPASWNSSEGSPRLPAATLPIVVTLFDLGACTPDLGYFIRLGRLSDDRGKPIAITDAAFTIHYSDLLLLLDAAEPVDVLAFLTLRVWESRKGGLRGVSEDLLLAYYLEGRYGGWTFAEGPPGGPARLPRLFRDRQVLEGLDPDSPGELSEGWPLRIDAGSAMTRTMGAAEAASLTSQAGIRAALFATDEVGTLPLIDDLARIASGPIAFSERFISGTSVVVLLWNARAFRSGEPGQASWLSAIRRELGADALLSVGFEENATRVEVCGNLIESLLAPTGSPGPSKSRRKRYRRRLAAATLPNVRFQ